MHNVVEMAEKVKAYADGNSTAAVNVYGAKNLIPFPYYQDQRTINGLTFTYNIDGSIKITGTATADTCQGLVSQSIRPLTLEVGLPYMLSYTTVGTVGGSSYAQIYYIDSEYNSSWRSLNILSDTTKKIRFTKTKESTNGGILIRALKGCEINCTIYPMLTAGYVQETTYASHVQTNKELMETNADLVNYYGSKNLIPYPFFRESGYTVGGFTFTYDEDGVVTVNGTYPTNTTNYFAIMSQVTGAHIPLIAGQDYILSMEISGFSGTLRGASVYYSMAGSDIAAIRVKNIDGLHEARFTPNETQVAATNQVIGLYFPQDPDQATVTNATVKVMVRLASIQDNTYVPYAKTNKQLTDSVAANEEASEELNDAVTDIVNVYGAKNLIPYPHYGKSGTVNGVTYTYNDDGSITMKGTCTALTWKTIHSRAEKALDLPIGVPVILSYKLVGTVSGGYASLYSTQGTSPEVWLANVKLVSNSSADSAPFTNNDEVNYPGLGFQVKPDTVLNCTVYPMIRLASIQDNTYVPYAKTNKKLTDEVNANTISIAENEKAIEENKKAIEETSKEVEETITENITSIVNVYGAKNLNSYPYLPIKYYTSNGITWIDNGDGTVTANGTATANVTYTVHPYQETSFANLILPNGKYRLTGCPSGGTVGTYAIRIARKNNNASSIIATDVGNGVTFALNGDDYSSDSVHLYIYLAIWNGTTVNNMVFKPMITLDWMGYTTYDDFATYAPTGNELYKRMRDAITDIANIYGSKNLLHNPLIPSYSNNGISYTRNSDGSVTVKGTATGDEYIALVPEKPDTINSVKYTPLTLGPGEYILSYEMTGTVGGTGMTSLYYIDSEYDGKSADWRILPVLNGSSYNALKFKKTTTCTNGGVLLRVLTGCEVNYKMYPMLRMASIEDTTWVLPAKTNAQLSA